ncbi:MAG: hypothetical protein RIS64_2787 [Bacteroidota bacterium]|jgi:hypothetical protein
MVQQSKIDAYLTGEYSETEKKAFESQLIADEALFIMVETQRALRRAGLRQEVEQAFAARPLRGTLRIGIIQRIAAGFLFFGLCFCSYNFFFKTDSTLLSAGNPTTTAIVKTALDEEDMVGQTIQGIILSIRNAPLKDNLLIINKLEKERPELVGYFQGLAYLNAGKVPEAKVLLQKIAATPNHPKQETAKEILKFMD